MIKEKMDFLVLEYLDTINNTHVFTVEARVQRSIFGFKLKDYYRYATYAGLGSVDTTGFDFNWLAVEPKYYTSYEDAVTLCKAARRRYSEVSEIYRFLDVVTI